MQIVIHVFALNVVLIALAMVTIAYPGFSIAGVAAAIMAVSGVLWRFATAKHRRLAR